MLRKLAVRYTSHIFPGETLITSLWKEGTLVIIEMKTKERNRTALIGYAEIR